MVAANTEHIQNLIETKKTEILSLASQIQDLTRRRETEISGLAVLQMSTSPIGQLPTELLAEIFGFHVPAQEFSLCELDTEYIVSAALSVSQVCRHWRQTAHGTPRLWVDGYQLGIDQEPTELDFEQTSAWLQRSHPLPISLYFHCGSHNPTTEFYKETRIFKALLSNVRRWKYVMWDIPVLSPLLDLPPGSLEALEEFTMEEWNLPQQDRVLDIFLSSPRLHTVSIDIRRYPDYRFFPLPWKQLTTLYFKSTLNEARMIMLQCINMVSVTLDACGWDFSQGTPTLPPIVVLPFLKDLQISFHFEEHDDSCHVGPFFAPFALPALKTLDLLFETDFTIAWDALAFGEFQDRAPNIEKIKLDSNADDVMAFDADTLIALLRHSPALKDLSIELDGIDNTFLLRALQLDEGDSKPLVPDLRHLALRNIGDRPSDRALTAMIRSRWWTNKDPALPGVAHLQSLRLTRKWTEQGGGVSRKLQTKLWDWEAQGLRVWVE
ncbi:hypothetical protein FB451DRAFT_1537 [Mycena latifolia]|nr:hypothetical protein FB451DRAFT_1537 [Mycena latifolia]